jgi:pimeloyl-ACP methyl ester carboxylesterase
MQSGMFNTGDVELYYEKRGEGPALLLISGAGGDAGYFSALADELESSFTVINYDRRGNSRSSGIAGAKMKVSEQADDAAALIRGLADGKALVFGNSGGAIVALDLAARHPDVVRAMVAHEPPVVKMLPENDRWFTFFDQIESVYQQAGPEAAGGTFVSTIRGEGTYPWPEEFAQRFFGNADFLFRTEWEDWGRWVPDENALSKVPFPLVLGAGESDRGLYYGRPSVEIARRIGAPWAEFPGIHLEFLRNPQVFAAALRAIITQLHTSLDGVPEAWNTLEGDEPGAPA